MGTRARAPPCEAPSSEANRSTGLEVHGSDATLEGVVVRGTLPDEATQEFGGGVAVQADVAALAPASLTARGVVAAENHEFGVFVSGATVQLDGLVMRDTLPRQSDQRFGNGLLVQVLCDVLPCEPPLPTTAVLRGSLIENNHYVGVAVVGADATLDAVLVRGTAPRPTDGAFGDGIAVAIASGGPLAQVPAHATVTSTASNGNVRSGLGNWGASVALGQSTFSCNGFDLEGETIQGVSFDFHDAGGNACGCPAPTGACVAQSAGLAPPELADPTP
jgi:hypothetical protein